MLRVAARSSAVHLMSIFVSGRRLAGASRQRHGMLKRRYSEVELLVSCYLFGWLDNKRVVLDSFRLLLESGFV